MLNGVSEHMFGTWFKKIYSITQVIIIMSLYIIPYTILRDAKNPALLLYWVLATILSGVLAMIYLRTKR